MNLPHKKGGLSEIVFNLLNGKFTPQILLFMYRLLNSSNKIDCCMGVFGGIFVFWVDRGFFSNGSLFC
jgi:hypothetical protein